MGLLYQSVLAFCHPFGNHNFVMGSRFLESLLASAQNFLEFNGLDQDHLGCDVILSALCGCLVLGNSYTSLGCFFIFLVKVRDIHIFLLEIFDRLLTFFSCFFSLLEETGKSRR
jgi:hypothetical protein